MNIRTRAEYCKKYILTFFKWLFLALFIGGVCGGVGTAFHTLVDKATSLRGDYSLFLYLLPVFGLVIAWLYRTCGMDHDRGTNTIFDSVRTGKRVPFRMAPLIFAGAALTHLGGGSAGREGAALQLGGSIGNSVGRLFRLGEKDLHIITMCGMSAVFSALFGTPLTAAFFCIEVISVGLFYYAALIPCLTSSLTAFLIARQFGIKPLVFQLTSAPTSFEVVPALKLLILAALCACLSIMICVTLRNSGKLLSKALPNQYIRIAVCGGVIVLLSLILRTSDYNGTGMGIISNAIAGKALPWAFVVKLIFTAITLGAGYRGGEIIPVMFIGSTFGCTVGALLGLDPGFAAAIGLVAVFCGTVNCPVSSIFLSIELFGGGSILYFALACAVSYMLSGRFSLYSAQKIVYSKLEPTYLGD